jgi:hypothetical protein
MNLRHALVVSLAGLAACQTFLDMHVLRDSRADNVEFELSDDGRRDGININHVVVYRCEDVRKSPAGKSPETVVWEVGGPFVKPTADAGARFRYGITPAGLVSMTEPRPLEAPGCYVVSVSAIDRHGTRRTAPLAFEIRADASVWEMTLREHHALWQR